MGLSTLLAYYLGDAEAIAAFASSRWSLLIGFLLVASASLSRVYDRVDLKRQPWRLAVPFLASTGLGLLVASALGVAFIDSPPDREFRDFPIIFLSLFWLTAPLAWLYSLPFERWTSSSQAASRARMICFAFVAAARVLIVSRAASVLLNVPFVATLAVVLCVADGALAVASWVAWWRQIPLVGGMAKIPIPPERIRAAQASANTGAKAVLLFPLLAIVAALIIPNDIQPSLMYQFQDGGSAPSFFLWAFCLGSIAFWLTLLPKTQIRLRLKSEIEQLFARDPAAALGKMIHCLPSDLPIGWSPPPDVSDCLGSGKAERVLERLEAAALAFPRLPEPWREMYREKFRLIFECLYDPKGLQLIDFIFFNPYATTPDIHAKMRRLATLMLNSEEERERRGQMAKALRHAKIMREELGSFANSD
jgi:hypothetical protein